MLAFAARHDVSPVIEHYSLEKVNDAMEHLRAGKARYRIVLSARQELSNCFIGYYQLCGEILSEKCVLPEVIVCMLQRSYSWFNGDKLLRGSVKEVDDASPLASLAALRWT